MKGKEGVRTKEIWTFGKNLFLIKKGIRKFAFLFLFLFLFFYFFSYFLEIRKILLFYNLCLSFFFFTFVFTYIGMVRRARLGLHY